VADLTQDELTVLLIAAEGERMMPIGRWEAPAQSLLTKGYLQRNVSPQDPSGMHNLTITSAGRKACAEGEDANMRALVGVGNEIVQAHRKTAARAEELAVLLVELATYSSSVTGDDKVKALRKWGKTVLERALELLVTI
jgi:hypothetical protein